MSTGESMLFDKRGYGIIFSERKDLYEKARCSGKKIAIIRNDIDIKTYDFSKSAEIFKSQKSDHTYTYSLDNEAIYRSKDLMEFFLKIHGEINIHGTLTENSLESLRKKEYKLGDVIFLEVNNFLKYDMEFSIILYFYFLNLQLLMPELYVVIDYHTDKFDFIERDIFKNSGPIPNYLKPFEADLFNLERFNMEVYSGTFTTLDQQIHYIVSETDIYNNEIHKAISHHQHVVYDNYAEFKKFQDAVKLRPQNASKEPIIVKFRTLEEILELDEIKANVIVVNTLGKISSSLLYGGNVPCNKQMHLDYIYGRSRKIKKLNTHRNSKFMFFFKDAKFFERPVIREIFERSPIIDYMKFERYKIDLRSLYSHYNSGTTHFLSVLRSEVEILKDLGYSSSENIFNLSIKHNIHPVIVAIINKWFNEKNKESKPFPRFPILVFVAIATTFNREIIEVKEHGDRERASNIDEISRFGMEMMEYVEKIKKTGCCIFKDNKASERLKKLMEYFDIKQDEIGYFNVNDFSKFLIYILKTYFSKLLLTNKSYSSYRGFHNDQLNWWISQSSAPNEIFPIIVHSSNNNKLVTLFVPIEQI